LPPPWRRRLFFGIPPRTFCWCLATLELLFPPRGRPLLAQQTALSSPLVVRPLPLASTTTLPFLTAGGFSGRFQRQLLLVEASNEDLFGITQSPAFDRFFRRRGPLGNALMGQLASRAGWDESQTLLRGCPPPPASDFSPGDCRVFRPFDLLKDVFFFLLGDVSRKPFFLTPWYSAPQESAASCMSVYIMVFPPSFPYLNFFRRVSASSQRMIPP